MKTNHSILKDKTVVSVKLLREVTPNIKKQQSWCLMVEKLIFCYLAVIFPVLCFCVSLNAEINSSLFYIGTAVFLILHFIGYLLTGKIRVLYCFCLLTFVLILLYQKRTVIINGFYVLENIFLQRCEEHFRITTWRYVVDGNLITVFTTFMMVCAMVLTLIVVHEVMRHYLELLYFFCLVIMVGIILFVGIIPEKGTFIGLLIIYFMMNIMRNTPGVLLQTKDRNIDGSREIHKEKVRMQAAFMGAIIFLISYLMVSFAFSKEFYHTKVNIEGPKSFLKKGLTDLTHRVRDLKLFGKSVDNYGKISSGGLSGGRLDGINQISFDGSTQLYVSADAQTDFLYLKGYAGAFYANDGWTSNSEEMREDYEDLLTQLSGTFLPETMANETLWVMQQQELLPMTLIGNTVWVNYEAANQDFLYAPYFNDFQTCKSESNCDLYQYPIKQSDHYYFKNVYASKCGGFHGLNDEVNFILAMAELIRREDNVFQQSEQAYRRYVDKYYQAIPKEGLSRLKKIVFVSKKSGNEKRLDLVSQVVSYLKEHTEYSLSPGATPYGKDFTENFLFDTHKGYCAHYATAAVLLLRNNGVPARYCEGYLVTKDNFSSGTKDGIVQVAVLDSDAHAWIEVYYDGIGWLPYEVTKGYDAEGSNGIEQSHLEKESKTTIAPTKAIEQQLDKEVNRPYNPLLFAQVVRFLLGIFLASILLLCAYNMLYYIYVRRKIKKRLYSGDGKKQVVTYFLLMEQIFVCSKLLREQSMGDYEYMEKIKETADWLPNTYQRAMDLVLVTGYGNKSPSSEEVLVVKGCYEELLEHLLSNKSLVVRIFIKYRYNLVK